MVKGISVPGKTRFHSLGYPEYSSLVTVQATLCLILSLPSMVKGISVPGKTRFHSLGYPEYSSLVTV